MFQATRRRLAIWYTTVTAVLILLFASGFYLYVRSTLIERIDDTLNHVVEVVQRSLVIDTVKTEDNAGFDPPLQVNIEASFRVNADTVDDDHIDLEWFSPTGELLWSTLSVPLDVPLHPDNDGETVHETADQLLRQVTQRVQVGRQVLGYLRVSHPWFEVTLPTRQLIRDLSLGTVLTVGAVAAIGWFLSGLAIAPVRDSYQRLKQFTADASHELRNPIAVIQTNVQVALTDPDPQFQQDQLRVVERLSRRLGRLVDDLLFLARQDSGMTPLRTEQVELDDLLLEVIEEQQAIATDQTLSFSLQFSEPADQEEFSEDYYEKEQYPTHHYQMEGDRDQLSRLFTNLVSNAIQYTPPAGQIEVRLQRLKHQGGMFLQVQIQDTGIGIPAEALPHLFDRFYRVDPARTHATPSLNGRVVSGSGLGLAIAQVIIDNHQGQIQVESQLEQGTTFTVLLPLSRRSALSVPVSR